MNKFEETWDFNQVGGFLCQQIRCQQKDIGREIILPF